MPFVELNGINMVNGKLYIEGGHHEADLAMDVHITTRAGINAFLMLL
ncbi:hypothetical protein [Bacillus sp. CH30_1T]|nr:hypothetical protein [Bacillus sp. CH30_1T]